MKIHHTIPKSAYQIIMKAVFQAILKTVMFAVLVAFMFGKINASTRYVVFTGYAMQGEQFTNIWKTGVKFVLEDAAAGDNVSFYHGITLKEFASFDIPPGPQFENNVRARAFRLAKEIARFKIDLLDALRPVAPGTPARLDIGKALDFAGTHLRKDSESLRIIMVGNPFFEDLRQSPAETKGDVPALSNLAAPNSILTAQGREFALKGATVHVAYLSDRVFISQAHYQNSAKFLAAFCESRGGNLVTFCPEIKLAFDRAREGIAEPFIKGDSIPTKDGLYIAGRHIARPASQNKAPESLASKPVPTTTSVPENTISVGELEDEDFSDGGSIPQATQLRGTFGETERLIAGDEPSGAPPQQGTFGQAEEYLDNPDGPESRQVRGKGATGTDAQPRAPIVKQHLREVLPPGAEAPDTKPDSMLIVVSWSANVGIDLYVKPDLFSAELSYQMLNTEKGRIFAGNRTARYCWAEIYAPINLRTLRAWVNFHSGWHINPTGNVTILYSGQSYSGSFQFSGTKGNRGGGGSDRHHKHHWLEIDLSQTIGGGNSSAGDAPSRGVDVPRIVPGSAMP